MSSQLQHQARRSAAVLATVLAGLVCIWLTTAMAADPSVELASTPPTTADSTAYVTNGTVNAIARFGGTTYIGGTFTGVSTRSC